MGSVNPSESDIVMALQSSGYLLEQEVATVFEGLGYTVRTGSAYEDQESGQSVSREIDVLATNEECCWNEPGALKVVAEFICECKNNRDPLVFLVRPIPDGAGHPVPRAPEEFLFPIQRFEVLLRNVDGVRHVTVDGAFSHLGLDQHHYLRHQSYRAVQVAKVYRDRDKWVANNADIYKGTFLPVVKQMLYRRNGNARWIRAGWPNYVYLFFPIVVVNDNMFAVDALADPLNVRPITHIHYRRELDSATTSGVFGVDFVTRSHVLDFVINTVQPFIDQVCDLAMTSADRFLQGVDADKQRNQ
jgi:hypothetical protein